ncbi:Ig-like domain-containing protein [Altererythrobacter sp. CAU 1778]
MSNDQSPPLYSRDYVTSSQIAGLGYAANTGLLQSGMTGEALKLAIIRSGQEALFTPEQLDNFVANHEFIGSTSRGLNTTGGDVVAFRNLTNNAIQIGIAGVNDDVFGVPLRELTQTDLQTALYGANASMYRDVQNFVFGLMDEYSNSFFDLSGHSAGGQMVQLVVGDAYLRGDAYSSRIVTANTFGSFGLSFGAADTFLPNTDLPELEQILNKLDEIEDLVGFVHFVNNSDGVPKYSDGNGYRLAGSLILSLTDLLGPLDAIEAHGIGLYALTLSLNVNNLGPIVGNPDVRPDALAAAAELLGLTIDQAEEMLVLAQSNFGPLPDSGEATLRLRVPSPISSQVGGIDPRTGATLPRNALLQMFGDGSSLLTDLASRTLELIYKVSDRGIPVNAAGEEIYDIDGNRILGLEDPAPVVEKTRIFDGLGSNAKGGVVIEQLIDPNTKKPISTKIRIEGNPLGIDLSDVGSVLGAQLGSRIAGGNLAVDIGASAILKTLGNSLGDTLDGIIGNQSVTAAVNDSFSTFGPELLANLKSAGIGAVSSLLTAELINVVGLDGVAGEALNSGAGAVVGQILANIAGINDPSGVFSGVDLTLIGNALGSFVGSRLASEVISFDTIGGQIGSAVGSTLGVLAAGELLKIGGVLGGPLGAAIGAFAGFIIGGLIGSVFGGTPRSGADVEWDSETGRFVTSNVYSRKGGSKDTARALADTVSATFNMVLDATGARLSEPGAIATGNYGMRKSDFVYRPVSTRDKSAITYRVSSKDDDAFAKLTNFGTYTGLTDKNFELIGGNTFVKRAIYSTVESGEQSAESFDASALVGNITAAQSYQSYLNSSRAIGALISAESESAFAAETAINLTRAVELGLNKRHRADWFGGFNALMEETRATAAQILFSFDRDFYSGNVSRLIGVGQFLLGDTVDISGQTAISSGSGDDTIIIAHSRTNIDGFEVSGGAGFIGDTTGLIINQIANNGSAISINVAATINSGAGNDVVHAGDLGNNVIGGSGNDTLYGGRLDDWLLGGEGNDRLDAGAENGGLGGDGNYLDGGAGDDQLFGREGSDWLEGGDGIDTLRAGDGGDILSGGAGEGDELYGGGGDDTYLLRRGDGADIAEDLDARAPTPPAIANPGDFPNVDLSDPIAARFAAIRSGAIKRDWLGTTAAVSAGQTSGGEDSIAFGYGITLSDVRLSRSDDGDDLVVEVTEIGEDGTEVLTGDKLTIRDWFADPYKRVEWLKFVDGTEIRIGDVTSFIVGTSGDDVLIGTGGNDFVYGGAGNDELRTLGGNDIGLGGSGDDLVSGGSGDDIVVGGVGDDRVIGGSGNDALTGDAGNDSLYGSQGADILAGGRGNDIMVGGAGDDRFRFARGDGHDVVFDDYSDDWTVVWQAGNWLNGYVFDPATGEVFDPDGNYVRRNFGTTEFPDFQWVGQFDYDDTTGELRQFTPPASATTLVSDKGEDTIEFALDINVQDIMFERQAGSNDLRVVIGRNNAEPSLASARDSLTLQDWYSAPGSIETFAFFAAGEIDVSATGYNLIGGTDGVEGGVDTPLRGTLTADWMTGAGGNDHLAGGSGDDIVAGNAGNDRLKGEAGNDVLYGGSGNDILDGGLGADVLSGGAGLDAASYASSSNAVTVYLSNAALNMGDAAGDTYDSIENLVGSGAGDVLGGDDGDNEITGGKGSDFLLGGLGSDTYVWNIGDGADVIEDVEFIAETIVSAEGDIGENYEVLWTQMGAPKGSNDKTEFELRLVHSDTGELIFEDRVFTYDGLNDQPEVRFWRKQGWQKGFLPATDGSVTRVAYDEQMDAGEADAIEMGAGISLADLFFEREGNDLRISYIVNDDSNNGDGLAVGQSNNANLLVRNHFLEKNRVEFLIFADGLAVDLANVLTADSSGVVNGSDLDELIVGQRGVRNDVLAGAAGDDFISGGEGDDQLSGGDGDDVLEGGIGADSIDGGAHSPAPSEGDPSTGLRGDTVRYATSGAGVAIDLASTGPQSGGDAQGDTLTGIENVTGSVHDDSLSGDDNDNVLDALGGNNMLLGRGGNDVLVSGDGADTLDGGAGEDNLSAGGGDDILRGGADNDVLAGLDGDDQLFGDQGDDILSAGRGNDRLEGGLGNDELIAGEGDDTLLGGAGKDTLVGEAGDDSLAGGADADTYFFAAGFGQDVLTDSEGANEILIDQSITYESLWFHRSGDDLVMTVRGADDTLTISDFFAAANAANIYSVQTATHRLFLGHPEVRNFLDTMQATGPTGAPAEIPAEVAAIMDRYWHEGTTARPYVEDFDLAIDEDTTTGLVAIDAIDHDENISRYEITGDALSGTASVDEFGRFSYAPDLNFNGEDSFTVAVVDADGNGREIEVRVGIAPVDDAPVIDGVEGGQPLAIDERAPLSATETGSVVGRILASEFDGEEIFFTLTDDADGRFTISADGVISVADGAALDHEANASHSITVRVTDAVASIDEQSFTIAINDVNEAPATPALITQTTFIGEGSPGGTVVASFALSDPEDTVPTLVADGNPGNLFEIVGGEVRLASEVDFETLAGFGFAIGDQDGDGRTDIAVSLTVHAYDGELRSDDADTITFYVEDVNEAPSALLTGNLAASFAERDRVPTGTTLPAITLAVLSVADPDLASQPNAQYTYTVDDARFEVVGNQLRLKEGVAFDFESEEQVTVTVTATDQSVDPLSISQDITFAVDNADDYLEGTPDADTLIGQANRDIITGLSGDDRIEGLTGDDTLTGNDGNDIILGGAGTDEIFGNADDDTLYGEAGADTISGGSGRDTISGGGDADTIDAGEGDDIILGDDDGASDAIDGGAGVDRLDYSALTQGVSADLSAGTADGDAVTNIEEIEGSVHADMLIGDASDNRLIGGAGADMLSGLGGSDRIEGGLDNDDISGGDGNDLLFGEEGDDMIAGDAGSDSLYGGEGADTLSGGSGDDRLEGGFGNDTLDAGDGNDTYIVDRRSNHDTIFNYDQLGTDIDVLGFNDTFGEITEHDLWFERQGDDLVVFVIGEDTSVRVTNWYLDVDPAGRANHRLDFLLGGAWVSRETDVEGLADFQSNFTRPTTIAELEALRADPVYDAMVANFYDINDPPQITGIADQRILEDGRMELVLTLADDYTPAAGIAIAGTVETGTDLLGPQGLVVGAVASNGTVTVTLEPAAHAAGTIGLSFTATDAGGVENTQTLELVIDPVADTPVITQLASTPATSGAAIALSLSIEFPDRDGSETQSIRIAGIPGGVALNNGSLEAATGDWVLAPADLAGLAVLAPAGWSQDLSLSVTAYASEGGTNAQSAVATTTLIINAPPTDILSGLSVDENAAGGTVIGYLQGVDPDGDTLTYALLDGADGRFTLDPDGLLKVGNGLKLDHEAAASHTILVRVTDALGATYERSVAVSVNDLNEAPSVAGDTSDAVFAEPVASGTVLASFAATDPDGTTPVIELVSGSDLFVISGSDVLLKTGAPATFVDAEAYANARGISAGDIDGDGRADIKLGTIEVVASDGDLQSSVIRRDIYIENVSEAPDAPSLITNNLYSETGEGATPHAGQVVATFALSDPDGATPALVITGGNDNGWFQVAGNSIVFAPNVDLTADYLRSIVGTRGVAANFNGDLDADGLKELLVANLTVAARDTEGLWSDGTTVAVRIEDRNEGPEFSPSSYSYGLAETSGAYTQVGTVAASDVDGPAGELTYGFHGGTSRFDNTLNANVGVSADGRLLVHRKTGVIYTASDTSFAGSGGGSFNYDLTVTDRNGDTHALTATSSLSVMVSDVNEPHDLVDASGSFDELINNDSLPPFTPIFDLADEMLIDPEYEATGQNVRWVFANGTDTDGIWGLTTDGKLYLKSGKVDYEQLISRTEYDTVWIGGEPMRVPRTVKDPSLATMALQVQAIDDSLSLVKQATFTATINDVNEGAVLTSTRQYYVEDDQGEGRFGAALTARDPDTGSTSIGFAIDQSSIVYSESRLSPGSSADVDNSGNPTISIVDGNRLSFQVPGDGEWEGGIKNHPTLGGRWYYQLDVSFDVLMTDPTGLQSRENVNVTFAKHGERAAPPIVFDLDGDGLELISLQASNVSFDMDGDGILDKTGWVSADDGLLALDRNSNGMIDDISEISFLEDVASAQSDLEGLAAFDTNSNGRLDAGDERFFEFRIWRDLNQDGISQDGELLTLPQSGITALDLTSTGGDGGTRGLDNFVLGTVDYERTNGTTGTAGDVFLAYETSVDDVDDNVDIALAAPVLFDFDGDGEALVSLSQSITSFDQDGDGERERTAWFGAGDAVLAIDRNENGIVDDISEISFLQDMEGAQTDLEGLAAYDINKDGLIDANDIDFAALKLWFDRDSDGVTDAGELVSLSEAGVSAISLESTRDETTGEQADGSIIYGKATFVFDNGSEGTIFDTGLAYLANNSTHTTGIAGSPDDPVAFKAASLGFERKSKKYYAYSLGGELAVSLRKARGSTDPRAGAMGVFSEMQFSNRAYGYLNTIVLDLDGDGIEHCRFSKAKARFDMNGDGIADDTGWTKSRDGFLVVDRNENGRVDDGSELSFMLDAPDARNAMQGLAAFDTNNDGLISVLDERFGELKIWVDADHDGVSDAGELRSLSDHGIASISIRAAATDTRTKVGRNVLLSTAVFNREDGSTGTLGDLAVGYKPSSKPQVATSASALSLRDMWRQDGMTRIEELSLQDILSEDFFRRFENLPRGEDPVEEWLRARNGGHLELPEAAGIQSEAASEDDAAEAGNDTSAASQQDVDRARMLALLMQDMAAFGGRDGLDDVLRDRREPYALAEFYS